MVKYLTGTLAPLSGDELDELDRARRNPLYRLLVPSKNRLPLPRTRPLRQPRLRRQCKTCPLRLKGHGGQGYQNHQGRGRDLGVVWRRLFW